MVGSDRKKQKAQRLKCSIPRVEGRFTLQDATVQHMSSPTYNWSIDSLTQSNNEGFGSVMFIAFSPNYGSPNTASTVAADGNLALIAKPG